MNTTIRRRAFLSLATASAAGKLLAQRNEPAGMILREKDPENLESPVSSLQTLMTPTEQFYVRNHFKVPAIARDAWKLKIEGAVDRAMEIAHADLLAMPQRSMPCMLECAGNGRVFLAPKENGAQWALGGAGNAEWSGVPLSAVLERAGVKPSAVEVIFEGADKGEVKDEPKSPGEIHYARSIPVSKARSGDVLLAMRMNGAPLSEKHGAPLRVIVPGWYGMASIKWLSRIVVADQPFKGFFQTLQYSYWDQNNGMPTLVPVTDIHVKSEIIRPMLDETVAKGATYRVQGLAWAGEANIRQVEVSTDGGRSWVNAELTGAPVRYSWRMFSYEWKVPPSAGQYILMARATDDRGRTQAMERDHDHRNYMITHVLPIEAQVR